MIGLVILGLIVGWVVLWVYVFKKARNRGERVAALLVAVLIPFWDLPIGYFEFQQHCSAEGGIRVYERVTPQDKVYFESLPSSPPAELLKLGFKVVEIRRTDGKGIVRYENHPDNSVSRTVQSPESLVAISWTAAERLGWNVYRDRWAAHSLGEKKVLATYTTFSWHGGWLQQSSWPLLRGNLDCFLARTDPLITLLRHGS